MLGAAWFVGSLNHLNSNVTTKKKLLMCLLRLMYAGTMQEERADDFYSHEPYYSIFLSSSGAVRPQFPAKFTQEASHQRLEEAKKQATGHHWVFPGSES